MMAALKSTQLRDHLCWLWRMGTESCDEALAEAASVSEQVLRVLGVEHDSLDHMLCQVQAQKMTSLCETPHLCVPHQENDLPL
jgi:hypothetical protein